MRGNAQSDGRPLGASKLWSYFRHFRSLQRRFPIDDVLLRSGDIRDQVAKLCEIATKF